MTVQYNTIEVVNNPSDVAAWSTTWPGYDGCGTRNVYHGIVIPNKCPASSVAEYEPVSVVEVKDIRRLKGLRPGIPPYRYTPRGVSRVTTKNFLVRRNEGDYGKNVFEQYGSVRKVGSTCTAQPSSAPCTGPLWATWRTVAHNPSGSTYTVNGWDADELNSALAKVQNDVSVEALTSLDVLTNIAEAREIPGLINSVSKDLTKILGAMNSRYSRGVMRSAARIRPIDLLKHPQRVLRKLGSEWMQYRYAIMPLVYTYRDIQKSIHRGIGVRTKKTASVSPKPNGTSLPGSNYQYKWVEYVGTQRYSASVFQYYSWTSLSRLASLGFNPLVTAWELIPYSFVADWFVNMGDYIVRTTTPNLAGKSWACVSHRCDYQKKTWVHFPVGDYSRTCANVVPINWYGAQPPASPSQFISKPEESQLLQEVDTQTYTRWLFSLDDAKLNLGPALNWRRMMDSAVMSLNLLTSLSKRFR